MGEVAFGVGAESMAASWPHCVAAPASSASTSPESETDLYPLIGLVFLVVQDYNWSYS